MGRVSKELKEVKKRAQKPWPVENVDYHIIRVAPGNKAPQGYIVRMRKKSHFTRDRLIDFMTRYKAHPEIPLQAPQLWFGTSYCLMPEGRPSPKWGPVCP